MPQTTHVMNVVESGDFTPNIRSVQVPDGEDWDILGISFTVIPQMAGVTYFAFMGFNLPSGGGIYETVSLGVVSRAPIGPEDCIAFCGAPGGANKLVTVNPGQHHATLELPVKILLPELSSVFARIVSFPVTTGEVKSLNILIDQSIHIGPA